jgi:hypothetical protein
MDEHQYFEFADYEVAYNQLYYYRVQETDVNGSVSYSEVRQAALHSGNLLGVEFTPNPTRGALVASGLPEGCSIHIFNTLGQPVVITQVQAGVVVGFEDLPTGVYLLRYEHQGQLGAGRVLKQ